MRLYALCQDIIALRLTTPRLLRERCRMQIFACGISETSRSYLFPLSRNTLLIAATALLNISYTVIVNKSYL